jgi:hypothetical protein
MIQRRFPRATREEYSGARRKGKGYIKRKRKNILKKQLGWIQDCNGRKESRKF